jgi:hypothetical protein
MPAPKSGHLQEVEVALTVRVDEVDVVDEMDGIDNRGGAGLTVGFASDGVVVLVDVISALVS